MNIRNLEENEPYLHVDDRINRLFVVGSDEQIKQVKDLLVLLDVPDGPEIKLVVMPLTYVLAGEVSGEISQLLQALSKNMSQDEAATTSLAGPQPNLAKTTPETRGPSTQTSRISATNTQTLSKNEPYLHVDDRVNRLIVVGSDEQIIQVHELLELLDVPEGPEIKLESLHVEHLLANEVAGLIVNLIQDLNQQQLSGSQENAASGQPPATGSLPVTPSITRTSLVTTAQPTTSAGGSLKAAKTGPFLHIDDRINRLLVIGSQEQIQQVKDLLALLDVPFGPEIKLVPLRVEHVLAGEVAGQITDLIRDLNQQQTSSMANGLTTTPATTSQPTSQQPARSGTLTTARSATSGDSLMAGEN